MVESSNGINVHTTVFVVGQTGLGKSTLGNILTGGNFKTSSGIAICTTAHKSITGNGFSYHDTPGYGDPNMTKKAWLELVTSSM